MSENGKSNSNGNASGGGVSFQSGVPEMPDWLCEVAQECWNETVDELRSANILSAIDRASLAAYCNVYARYIKSSRALAQYDNYYYECKTQTGTIWRPRPEYMALKDAETQIKQFASEFGLTPLSRKKIKDSNQGDLFDQGEKIWEGF